MKDGILLFYHWANQTKGTVGNMFSTDSPIPARQQMWNLSRDGISTGMLKIDPSELSQPDGEVSILLSQLLRVTRQQGRICTYYLCHVPVAGNFLEYGLFGSMALPLWCHSRSWTSSSLRQLCLWTPGVPFILSDPFPPHFASCHVCYSRINFRPM